MRVGLGFAALRGFLYQVKYEWILRRAVIVRPFYVHCRLEIKGSGRVHFGPGCSIRRSVFGFDHVSIYFNGKGGRVDIGKGAILRGSRIGCFTAVGIGDRAVVEGASLFDTDFHNVDAARRDVLSDTSSKPLWIGEDSYVGPECLLGKGTLSGAGSVFLPNTVLTWRTVPPSSGRRRCPWKSLTRPAGSASTMIEYLFALASALKSRYEERRLRGRWARLRSLGMQIGSGVNLPMSTWVDTAHCYLISIGDNCGFGAECAILAHDAMPNEYLDATKVGRVKIHESCHFGMRTIILPGVEIGPRCIVGSGSVVIRDIPPDSVAAGNPARVICSLQDYLNRHRECMKTHPLLPFDQFSPEHLTAERIALVRRTLDTEFGYITGGYTAMVNEGKCLVRT